jgi:hypothetical protein
LHIGLSHIGFLQHRLIAYRLFTKVHEIGFLSYRLFVSACSVFCHIGFLYIGFFAYRLFAYRLFVHDF